MPSVINPNPAALDPDFYFPDKFQGLILIFSCRFLLLGFAISNMNAYFN